MKKKFLWRSGLLFVIWGGMSVIQLHGGPLTDLFEAEAVGGCHAWRHKLQLRCRSTYHDAEGGVVGFSEPTQPRDLTKDTIPGIFTRNAVINGKKNEYTTSCKGCEQEWEGASTTLGPKVKIKETIDEHGQRTKIMSVKSNGWLPCNARWIDATGEGVSSEQQKRLRALEMNMPPPKTWSKFLEYLWARAQHDDEVNEGSRSEPKIKRIVIDEDAGSSSKCCSVM